MKYKIIFGVIIPLIIIIALAIVASYGEVKVKPKYIKELSVKEILGEKGIKYSVKIGELKLSNEYSLPKKHELVRFGACLVDKDKNKQTIEAGYIEYSEGEYEDEEPYLIDSRYNNYKSVEVGAGEEKTVHVYLRPSYDFQYKNYTQLVEEYGDYDKIILYKNEKTGRYNYYGSSCYNLGQDVIDKSVQIDLVY